MSDVSSGRAAALLDQVRRWLRGVRIAYLPDFDRRPPVRLALGPSMPGWALRLVAAAVAAAGFAVLLSGTGWLALASIATLALLLRPGRFVPMLLTLTAAGMLAVSAEPSIPRTAWLVLTLHLSAVVGLVAAQVTARARIELAVLVAPLRALLLVQLVAQPIALVGALVAGAHLTVAILPVAAVLGVGALILLWAPTLRDS